MRQPLGILVCLLLLLGPAAAEDAKKEEPKKPAKPLTAEQAADAVVKAAQAKDEAALKALATKTEPDPKQVIEKLCELDYPEEAEAFAKAAPGILVKDLLAHAVLKKRPPLETLVAEVFRSGDKLEVRLFDRDAAYVHLEKAAAAHLLRRFSLRNENDKRLKVCIVRRYPPGPGGKRKPDDVILVNGHHDQGWFYLTALSGELRGAALKKRGSKAKPIDKKAAKVELAAEIAFWRWWLKDTRATREEDRRKR